MREIKKRFVVPGAIASAVMDDLFRCANTFNSHKLGKGRRGTVMLSGWSGTQREDGQWEVIIGLTGNRSPYMKFGSRRIQIYEFTDFRKPLRKLAMADSSR